jgi:hypothetical protein
MARSALELGFGYPIAFSGGMSIAKITGNGLISIAALVACLWGCLLAEHHILVNSARQQNKELIELRHLRDRRFAEPASAPVHRHSPSPLVG